MLLKEGTGCRVRKAIVREKLICRNFWKYKHI